MAEAEQETPRRPRIAWFAVGLAVVGAVALGGYLASQGAPRADIGPEVAAGVPTKVVTIPVQGMSCSACVANVKRTLSSLDGILDVEVSLANREARVRYVEEEMTPERLVSAIEELGYRASLPPDAPGTSAAGPRLKTVTIPVEGMACEYCAATVEGGLAEVPGVEDATVSAERREARVTYREGEATPERLVEAIDAQGFDAGTPSSED